MRQSFVERSAIGGFRSRRWLSQVGIRLADLIGMERHAVFLVARAPLTKRLVDFH
jgi:hypothetical protein